MKALVTGATGFVGSHLVEALVRRGDTVTALVRSPGKAALLSALAIRQIKGDLHDAAALQAAVAGQEIIYHVAGLTAARNEAEFLHGNRDGTINLLRAAESSGGSPRLVLVSSMAAGGPAPRGTPLTGSESPGPVTQYGRSKLAGERAVQASTLPWTIVRPPMVYGPRDHEVLKVFKLAGPVTPVFGDGSQELSAVYGPDLADALIAAGTATATVGRIYYACHPEVFHSRDLVQRIGALKGSPRVRILPLPRWVAVAALAMTGTVARLTGRTTILTPDKANEFFQEAWTGDPHPLMRDSGWHPSHNLATGLTATAAWYREQGWL